MSVTPRRPSSPRRAPSPTRTPLPLPLPRDIFSPTTPVTRSMQSPSERGLRRPMSMMTLPTSATTSSRASSATSVRSAVNSQVFRGNIHVGVRTKPEDEANPLWYVEARAHTISHATAGSFTLDQVYDGGSTNGQIFDNSVEHLIMQVVEGFNATVFAYGMTGSGKTFSMQGDTADPGIIPRSANLLFQLLRLRGQPTTIKLSYLEIYNERLNDLLRPSQDTNVEITLRDDPVMGIRAVGLTEIKVNSPAELLAEIAKGDIRRRTSSTQFNLHSSRSHAVVQISLSGDDKQSVLYLCDLAGSERAVSQVERRKEGAYINKSLLTLGTVISRLSMGAGGHVPFRDSKLTRLLQPSLTGRALVSVLCTMQTNPLNMTESLNTLRFAARAKNIVVTAKRNSILDENPSSLMNDRYMAIIEQQRLEINQLKADLCDASAAKEDLQGQLDFYMKLSDTNADESLEGVLADIPGGIEGHHGSSLSDIDEESIAEQSKADKLEIQRLNDQVSSLISQIAHTNNELAKMQYSSTLGPPAGGDPSLQDLREEIEELKETIRDKNKIIEYLRGSTERRATMNKFTPLKSKIPEFTTLTPKAPQQWATAGTHTKQ